VYSAQPDSFEELLLRAQRTIDRQTKSFVEDAITYARWILLDGAALLSNLTETQRRCNELLEENRVLKTKFAACVMERAALLEDAERMAGVRK
jgi:hypothetical protein